MTKIKIKESVFRSMLSEIIEKEVIKESPDVNGVNRTWGGEEGNEEDDPNKFYTPDDLKPVDIMRAEDIFNHGYIIYIQDIEGRPSSTDNLFSLRKDMWDASMNIYKGQGTPGEYGFMNIINWIKERNNGAELKFYTLYKKIPYIIESKKIRVSKGELVEVIKKVIKASSTNNIKNEINEVFYTKDLGTGYKLMDIIKSIFNSEDIKIRRDEIIKLLNNSNHISTYPVTFGDALVIKTENDKYVSLKLSRDFPNNSYYGDLNIVGSVSDVIILKYYDELPNRLTKSTKTIEIPTDVKLLNIFYSKLKDAKRNSKTNESINESTDQDRYEDVVFLQGEEADEALSILDNEGQDAAMNYLMQWHNPGQHMGMEDLGNGSSDHTYERDGYHMAWNSSLGYIGLAYDLGYNDNSGSNFHESKNPIKKSQIKEGVARNIPKIEKYVNQINELIAMAVDSDGDKIGVIWPNGTWDEPFTYDPIIYRNGALKITSYSPYTNHGKPNVDIVRSRDMEYDGVPTLQTIKRMFTKAVKDKDKYSNVNTDLNEGIFNNNIKMESKATKYLTSINSNLVNDLQPFDGFSNNGGVKFILDGNNICLSIGRSGRDVNVTINGANGGVLNENEPDVNFLIKKIDSICGI